MAVVRKMKWGKKSEKCTTTSPSSSEKIVSPFSYCMKWVFCSHSHIHSLALSFLFFPCSSFETANGNKTLTWYITSFYSKRLHSILIGWWFTFSYTPMATRSAQSSSPTRVWVIQRWNELASFFRSHTSSPKISVPSVVRFYLTRSEINFKLNSWLGSLTHTRTKISKLIFS